MTYNCVNEILENNNIPAGYAPFEDDLRLMLELSNILRQKMVRHGYLEFNRPEPKILVDENCHPTDIVLRERGVGENLIEDFMIIANECIATHIFYLDLAGIYRIHEVPEEEKIKIAKNLKEHSDETILQDFIDFIDEKTLTEIAGTTNGNYFRATSNDRLKQVYQEIDKLEKTKLNVKEFSKREEEFEIFAWIAFLCILLDVLLRNSILKKIP
mgnify:CR=1 FL=1